MPDIFSGARLVLLDEFSDPFNVALPIFFDDAGENDRPIQFSFSNRDQVLGWQIVNDSGAVLDTGVLTKERAVRRGDRIVFAKGSIKSAIIGDILGITAVFMPSGFVAGVTPPTPSGGTTLSGGFGPPTPSNTMFAYPQQEVILAPWWLPKREWVDPLPDGWVPDYTLLAQLGGWQKRLAIPSTWCRETVKRQQQELIKAGVF